MNGSFNYDGTFALLTNKLSENKGKITVYKASELLEHKKLQIQKEKEDKPKKTFSGVNNKNIRKISLNEKPLNVTHK